MAIDACIKYDTLTQSSDAFLREESTEAASKVAAEVTEYLARSNAIPSGPAIILVCAARHSKSGQSIPTAERPDTPIVQSPQPLVITNFEFANLESIEQMTRLATQAQSIALDSARKGEKRNIFALDYGPSISASALAASAVFIANATKIEAILYIAINGRLESEAKASAKAIGKTAASVLLAIAGARSARHTTLTSTGQVVNTPGFGFYRIYSAVKGLEIEQAVGALIDLQGGQLAWSNSLSSDEIVSTNSIDLLLFDITHRIGSQWTPPGTLPSGK